MAGLGALAAAVAVVVWGAVPASAGGPTSVLLVSPGSQETAALYNDQKGYRELEQLLGPPGTGTRNKPPEANLAVSRLINVTWMLHDVTPWRVDRVYPAAKDEHVWIHTSGNLTDSADGRWHRAEDPAELRDLLKVLGLMGPTSGAGVPSPLYPAPWETAQAAPAAPDAEQGSAGTQAAAAQRTAAPADGTDWWWAIPGAVAGAALALVLRPYVTRWPPIRQRRDPGPRQELLDL
ncbi:hypothetical protein N4P33_17495 [Streptomyces sp. 15-116A]|uniref:hypothetical protein n=1 Tax=Streptomyces sp. 15-116A TaxID=2259035 RepID=UPI0021B41764|nr:hypothetical protein [Streptomyces sp. 15-116A]MCT7353943.1 hypothetical protein [Streptomyces sp. 15-116A]